MRTLSPEVTQTILNLRDELLYHQRRATELNETIQKIMVQAKLTTLQFAVLVPDEPVSSTSVPEITQEKTE